MHHAEDRDDSPKRRGRTEAVSPLSPLWSSLPTLLLLSADLQCGEGRFQVCAIAAFQHLGASH